MNAGLPLADPEALAAFVHLEERLRADGVAPDHAAEIAMLITTSVEGAVLVARATGALTPLDLVHRQLRALVAAETGERKA